MVEGEDLLGEIRREQQEPKTEPVEREPCHVIEVDWVLREADGKLTFTGFRTVTGKPRQHLMVEVVDGKRGIQSEMFLRQCRHVARLMGVDEGDLKCEQGSEGCASGS